MVQVSCPDCSGRGNSGTAFRVVGIKLTSGAAFIIKEIYFLFKSLLTLRRRRYFVSLSTLKFHTSFSPSS